MNSLNLPVPTLSQAIKLTFEIKIFILYLKKDILQGEMYRTFLLFW